MAAAPQPPSGGGGGGGGSSDRSDRSNRGGLPAVRPHYAEWRDARLAALQQCIPTLPLAVCEHVVLAYVPPSLALRALWTHDLLRAVLPESYAEHLVPRDRVFPPHDPDDDDDDDDDSLVGDGAAESAARPGSRPPRPQSQPQDKNHAPAGAVAGVGAGSNAAAAAAAAAPAVRVVARLHRLALECVPHRVRPWPVDHAPGPYVDATVSDLCAALYRYGERSVLHTLLGARAYARACGGDGVRLDPTVVGPPDQRRRRARRERRRAQPRAQSDRGVAADAGAAAAAASKQAEPSGAAGASVAPVRLRDARVALAAEVTRAHAAAETARAQFGSGGSGGGGGAVPTVPPVVAVSPAGTLEAAEYYDPAQCVRLLAQRPTWQLPLDNNSAAARAAAGAAAGAGVGSVSPALLAAHARHRRLPATGTAGSDSCSASASASAGDGGGPDPTAWSDVGPRLAALRDVIFGPVQAHLTAALYDWGEARYHAGVSATQFVAATHALQAHNGSASRAKATRDSSSDAAADAASLLAGADPVAVATARAATDLGLGHGAGDGAGRPLPLLLPPARLVRHRVFDSFALLRGTKARDAYVSALHREHGALSADEVLATTTGSGSSGGALLTVAARLADVRTAMVLASAVAPPVTRLPTDRSALPPDASGVPQPVPPLPLAAQPPVPGRVFVPPRLGARPPPLAAGPPLSPAVGGPAAQLPAPPVPAAAAPGGAGPGAAASDDVDEEAAENDPELCVFVHVTTTQHSDDELDEDDGDDDDDDDEES